MKKLIMIFISVFISVTAFSKEMKLPQSYNQSGTWNICYVDSEGKITQDCTIIFKGNPSKDLKIYEAEDPHGMYISYKNITIVSSDGGDLRVVKATSNYDYLEGSNVNVKMEIPDNQNRKEESAGIIPVGSELIGLIGSKEFKNLKFFKTKNSEIAAKYYNMTFISEDNDSFIQNATAWN